MPSSTLVISSRTVPIAAICPHSPETRAAFGDFRWAIDGQNAVVDNAPDGSLGPSGQD
jgi:antitoxin (DNA-binding transcriptional repressor) of toxin-antitoxin stability system